MKMLLSQWTIKQPAQELIGRLRRENRALRAEVDRLSAYRELAYKDDLSGLHNRRYFEERIGKELARAQRSCVPLSLLMIDLDQFKAINDRAGHLHGDEVLRFVGRFLRSVCRISDTAFRLGGDEFVLLLPDTNARGAQKVADRIQSALAQAKDIPELPEGLSVRLSVGISTFPDTGACKQSLMRAADQAMYAHKAEKHTAHQTNSAV